MHDNMKDFNSLQEFNRYQDPAFPVGMYTVTIDGIEPEGRGHMDLHWHDELQYTVMLSGSCIMQVSGQDYLLKEGQGIFINRDLLHITRDLSPDGKYFSINFPDKMLSYFSGSRMEKDYVKPYTDNLMNPVMVFSYTSEWNRKILSDLMKLREVLLGKESYYQYAAAMLITGIWYEQFTHTGKLSQPSETFIRTTDLMKEMISYIHEHYAADIRIEDIADAAGIGEDECFRCFRESIQDTPKGYLIKYRLSRATELLSTTDLSLEEIARLSGFRSRGQMADFFRDNRKPAPAEIREYSRQ